jgi:hypothetical protein
VRVVEPLGSELHAIFSIDAPTAGGRALTTAEDAEDLPPGLAYNGVARLGPRAMVRPGDRAVPSPMRAACTSSTPTPEVRAGGRRTRPAR